jgi:hypothetical protein
MAGALLLSYLRNSDQHASDLMASWMAGKHFAAGSFGEIYAPATGLFTMRPPASWQPFLIAAGYSHSVFPFVYPPLWAWLAALVTPDIGFRALVTVASLLNPALLIGTIFLALRGAVPARALPWLILLGLGLMATSLPGLVALEQNQPQILVAFLTVLAIDRARAGAPRSAGAALALAASIKLYPAVFALFWLARGRPAAALWFALIGLGLGLLSILVAGWPLHAAFLAQIRDISNTALYTFFTWSLDPTIAQQVFPGAMQVIVDNRVLEPGAVPTGWSVMPKPPLWRWADRALIAATLAGLLWLARTRMRGDILFWPAAFTLVALVSPLSWGYHYLAPLAFAPALVTRYAPRPATVLLFCIYLPQSILPLSLSQGSERWLSLMQPAGTLAMLVLALALIFAPPARDT